jgi:hypothetical protein
MTILETVQLHIPAGSDVAVVEGAIAAQMRSLPQLKRWQLGRNLEGSWGAGTHTLDLHWDDATVATGTLHLDHISGIDSAERLVYESIGGGVRDAGLENGIWRTLLLRTRPEAAAHVHALEQDLLSMPRYMKGIRNWRLGRVVSKNIGGGEWTHVWQQEYARIDDLLGEYLVHPFHWGWVDRWFDMEFPEWTVDRISHAFCSLPISLLTTER